VAAAVRQRWSDVSVKKSALDLWKKDDFPRLRFERMTSSNNLMAGSSTRALSRSWMNSLKPVIVSEEPNEMHTTYTLSLLHHEHVLLILVRHALHKLVHLEMIDETRFLLVARRRHHISPIRIQQAGKAPHKRCPNLVGSECGRTDYAYRAHASSVRICTATFDLLVKILTSDRRLTSASVESLVGFLLAYRARRLVFIRHPLHAMAFLPPHRICVAYRLHRHARHDCRCRQGRLGVH
jgi:hypothetical protein